MKDMKGLGDPFSQLARQKCQLEGVIDNLKYPPLPIYTQVVLTHNQARLHPNTPTLKSQLSFHTNLPLRMQRINDLNKNTVLTNKELQKLARTLNRKHESDSFNFMEYYGLSNSEILKGVICSNCLFSPMRKYLQVWKCPGCMSVERASIVPTLFDFKYLGLGDTITNQELRDFIYIDSVFVASRLLASQNFPHKGNKKAELTFLNSKIKNHHPNPRQCLSSPLIQMHTKRCHLDCYSISHHNRNSTRLLQLEHEKYAC